MNSLNFAGVQKLVLMDKVEHSKVKGFFQDL